MKYSELNLVDSQNDRILEIESIDLFDKKFIQIIVDAFDKAGYKKSRGEIFQYNYSNYSFKYGFRDYIRIEINNKSRLWSTNFKEAIEINSIVTGVDPKNKSKKLKLHTLKIDFDKIASKIEESKNNRVENKQNRTVTKFKKDLVLPWVLGNIQEFYEDFTNVSISSTNSITGSYKNKNIEFHLSSPNMTKKVFSNIDFDDINFCFRIKHSKKLVFHSNLHMSGIRLTLSNWPVFKAMLDTEESRLAKEIEPLEKSIFEMEQKIRETEFLILKLKIDSEKNIKKFCDEQRA